MKSREVFHNTEPEGIIVVLPRPANKNVPECMSEPLLCQLFCNVAAVTAVVDYETITIIIKITLYYETTARLLFLLIIILLHHLVVVCVIDIVIVRARPSHLV